MKLTHRWLESLCPHGRSPGRVAQILQALGHEVASVRELPDGDTLWELEITANRADCLSVLGLAHEMAAATGTPVRVDGAPAPEPAPGEAPSIESPADCPLYTLRRIRGVKVGASPAWLSARLEALGMKPISNVVDATNYLLHELGQPLHAFDAGKLEGPLSVRRARAGERLKTLDLLDRTLSAEDLVIADARGPLALAGVMGGEASAVSASTREVLLESALFDPACIRRTARRMKLQTDASYRFERGVDPAGVARASARAAALIRELAGGEAGPLAAAGAVPPAPKAFRLRASRLAALLGFEVPGAQVVRILSGLGCLLRSQDDGWEISPPSRRARDLRSEPEAVEEVARIWGYDKVPSRMGLPLRMSWKDPAREMASALSGRLRAAGFSEAVTPSFADARGAGPQVPGTFPLGAPLVLMNPMLSDQTHLRRSLLPGLLVALAHNESVGEAGGRLFETGRVYGASRGREPCEAWAVALAGAGDLKAFRGAVELAAGRVLEAGPGEAGEAFEPGRALLLRADGCRVGALGPASASWTQALALRDPPFLAELALGWLLEKGDRTPRFQALPRFPAVDRDLAVVVEEAVTWGRVAASAASVPCAFRESVNLFDLYRGKQAGPGRKSLAFSVRFRHPERTLTREEVDAVMAGTVAALARDCGAELRR